MSSSTETPELWMSLVGRSIENRESDRGFVSRVRHGLNPENEMRAYADVIPYAGEREDAIAPLLKATALIVRHPGIPHATYDKDSNVWAPSIGQSFQRTSRALAARRGQEFWLDPANPDTIARRLTLLHTQDLEDAAITLDRALTLSEDTGVAFDFFALTKLLLRWGNGITEQSQHVRRTLLRDYYKIAGTQFTAAKPADRKGN